MGNWGKGQRGLVSTATTETGRGSESSLKPDRAHTQLPAGELKIAPHSDPPPQHPGQFPLSHPFSPHPQIFFSLPSLPHSCPAHSPPPSPMAVLLPYAALSPFLDFSKPGLSFLPVLFPLPSPSCSPPFPSLFLLASSTLPRRLPFPPACSY